MKSNRDNSDKVDFTMLRYEFLKQVSQVLMHGEQKYSRENWLRSFETLHHEEWVQTCEKSMARHYHAYMSGDYCDNESGLSHLSHMAANIMMIIEYIDGEGQAEKSEDKSPVLGTAVGQGTPLGSSPGPWEMWP